MLVAAKGLSRHKRGPYPIYSTSPWQLLRAVLLERRRDGERHPRFARRFDLPAARRTGNKRQRNRTAERAGHNVKTSGLQEFKYDRLKT